MTEDIKNCFSQRLGFCPGGIFPKTIASSPPGSAMESEMSHLGHGDLKDLDSLLRFLAILGASNGMLAVSERSYRKSGVYTYFPINLRI